MATEKPCMKLRSARLVGSIAVSATLGVLMVGPRAQAESSEANFVSDAPKSTAPTKPSVGDLTKNVFGTEKILQQLQTRNLPKGDDLQSLLSSLACQVPNWEKGWSAHQANKASAKVPAEFQLAKDDTGFSGALKTLAVTDPKRLGKMAKAAVEAHRETFRKSALVDMKLTQLQNEANARAAKRRDDKSKEINKQIGGGLGVPPDYAQKKSAEIEAKFKQLEKTELAKDKALFNGEKARLQKISADELLKEPEMAKAWAALKTNPDKTQSGLEEISKSYQKLEAAVEKDPKLAYRVMGVKGQNVLAWMDSRAQDWFQNHQEKILNGGAVGSINEPARLSYKFADRFSATVDAYLSDAKGGGTPSPLSTYATRTGLNDVEPKMANQEQRAAWNEAYWEIPRAITSAAAVGATFLSGGVAAPFAIAMMGAGAIDLGHTLATHDRWKEASVGTALNNLKNNPELQVQTALFVGLAAAPALKGGAQGLQKFAGKLVPAGRPGAERFASLMTKMSAPLEVGSEMYFGFLSAQGAAAAAELCAEAADSLECKKALLYAVLDAVTQGKQTHAALAKLKASQACRVQVAKSAPESVKDADTVTKPAGLGQKLVDIGNTPITAKAILDPIKNMNAKVKTQLGTLLAKASPQQLKRFQEWADKFSQKIARKTKAEQEKAWDDSVTSCLGKKGAVAKVDRDIIEVGGKIIFLSDNASYLPQTGEGI